MGNSPSNAEAFIQNDTNKKFLMELVHSANVFGDCKEKSGGGSNMYGGAGDDVAYIDSSSHLAKRELIEKLSIGINEALNLNPPEKNSSSSMLVKQLASIVPHPAKGKSIVADGYKQENLCNSIAKVVNDLGGSIDMDQKPDAICNNVGELIESLGIGLHNEFIAVSASVEKILENINELREMLYRSFNKMIEDVNTGSDESLKLNVETISSMHKLLMDELDRQIKILSNITNSNIKDVDTDIVKLLKENEDFKGIIASLKGDIGSSEWGDKLAYYLSGISNIAQMANIVQDALKTIGMDIEEYKKAHKLSDLQMKTLDTLMKKDKNSLTKDYMNKFYKAVEELKKYHPHHMKIYEKISGAYEYDEEENVLGGRIKLEKKLKKQQTTRQLMLNDFSSKSKVLMDRVYQAIFSIGRRIGAGQIKLTDDLYRFKVILDDMTLVFRDGIEYALTGYYTHANAVEHKERFMGLLRSALMTLEPLKQQDDGFKTVASSIESYLQLVDFYNDNLKVHTGTTSKERPGQEVEGGKEFAASSTLKNARNSFNHFYSIAKFKLNLEVSSSEMQHYNKEYTAIVGSAVGKKLDKIYSDHKKLVEKINADATASGYKDDIKVITSTTISDIGLKAGPGGEGGIGTEEWSANNIIEILESQIKAKQKLYRVAEAVDEYLQKFTDAVATSPADIQEVSKLLSSVEIMANWFNEKSGDSIASVYEIFPWTMLGMRTYMNKSLQEKTCGKPGDNVIRTKLSGHYYSSVLETKLNADPDPVGGAGGPRQITSNDPVSYTAVEDKFGLPGNPFLPISPARAKFAHKFAKYAVDKVYVLKNIISAFTYLGKKFGDEDLSKSGSFMSPTEMYKSLMEYVYVSALTMGWNGDTVRLYGKKDTLIVNDYTPTLAYSIGTNLGRPYGYASSTSNAGTSATPGNLGGMFRIGPYYPGLTIGRLNGEIAAAQQRNVATITPGDMGNTAGGEWPNNLGEETKLRAVSRMKSMFSFAMSGVEDKDGNPISGWKSVFQEEDQLFITIIKAMAAKVFTVTGLYNMMNFGDSMQSYALSPTRLILGGGKVKGGDSFTYQTPEVYPEAVELYARLPLLAEFYRNVFCFEEPCGDDPKDITNSTQLLISMVPEVGSLWAGFIRTIFEQPANTNGMYTENVTRRLVHEINSIYQFYKRKSPDNVIMAVITDFIAEVNSRYGLMNRQEIDKYRTDESSRRSQAMFGTGSEDPDDFDILDEDLVSTGIAPSDRYTKATYSSLDGEHTVESGIYRALKIFRRRIDKRVSDIMYTASTGRPSTDAGFNRDDKNPIPEFGRIIMSTKESLKNIESTDGKFKLVSTMMTNMDTQTQTDGEAAVMFHETIVAPLAVLTSITNMLESYQQAARNWNAEGLYTYLHKDGLIHGANKPWLDNTPLYSGNNFGAAVGGGVTFNRLIPELNKALKEFNGDAQSMCLNMMRNDTEQLPRELPGLSSLNVVDLTNSFSSGLTDWVALPQMVSDDPDWNPRRHVAYCLIRWEAVFKNLIGLVYGLTADLGSMCEVSYQNKKLVVNTTKLQTVCEEVFATIRKSFDKFRGSIDRNIIEKYEKGNSTGSVNWVQEHLIDNIFNDQDRKSGIKRANNIITKSLLLVANIYPDDLSRKATYLDYSNTGSSKYYDGFPVGSVFSELTHYNSRTMSSAETNGVDIRRTGINMMGADDASLNRPGYEQPWQNFGSIASLSGVLTQNDMWQHLMLTVDTTTNPVARRMRQVFAARHDYYLQNSTSGRTDPGFRGDTNVDGGEYRITHNDDNVVETQQKFGKFDTGMGLMMKFNEVFAAYLSQFWDTTTAKIYAPLIETPANGPLNQEVFKGQGWPDLADVANSTDKGYIGTLRLYMNNAYDADGDKVDIVNNIFGFDGRPVNTEELNSFFTDIDIPQVVMNDISSYAATPVHMISTLVKNMIDNRGIPGIPGEIDDIYVLSRQFQDVWTNKDITDDFTDRIMNVDGNLRNAITKAMKDNGVEKNVMMIGEAYTADALDNIIAAMNDAYGYNGSPAVINAGNEDRWIRSRGGVALAAQRNVPATAAIADDICTNELKVDSVNDLGAGAAPIAELQRALNIDRIGINILTTEAADPIAVRGSMHWHLFDMKRRIINRLASIGNGRGPDAWKNEFLSWLSSLADESAMRWEKEEMNRMFENDIRVVPGIAADGVSGIDIFEDIKANLLQDSTYMRAFNAKLLLRRNEVNEFFKLYTDLVRNVAGTTGFGVVEATVAATMAIEPLELGDGLAIEYLGVTARVTNLLNGFELSEHTSAAGQPNYTYVSVLRKHTLYKILAYAGGRLGRVFDVVFEGGTLDDVLLHLRPGYDRFSYYERGITAPQTSRPGGVGTPFVTGNDSIDDNPTIQGDSQHITSKLLGFGMCTSAISPTPLDFLDFDQLNDDDNNGYSALGRNGNGGLEWYDILQNVLFDAQAGLKTIMGRERPNDFLNRLSPDSISARIGGEGDPRYILFASISKALMTALTETNQKGEKVITITSIAEVPLRTKEMMKAHLPMFWEMFKMISKRADLLKGCLKIGVNCKRQDPAWNAIKGRSSMPGVHGGTTDCVAWDRDSADRWYTQLLDQISNASETMCSTIKNITLELNDAPLYLETKENSITEYKNTNGAMPFMPLSSMTLALVPGVKKDNNGKWSNNERRDPNIGYHGTSSGDPLFQYQYGTRLVLHGYDSKPAIEHLPGMKDIMVKYNNVAQGTRKVEEKTYGQYVGKVVELFRYATSTRINAPLFGADRRVVDNSKLDQANLTDHTTYQMTKSVSTVVELTTSSDKELSVSAIVSHVSGVQKGKVSRYSSMIYNIIDLNVSPINVHAMRREIPLANLYNYGYTFDSFVAEIVQSSYDSENDEGEILGAKLTTHEVMAGMCKNPYILVPKEIYYNKLNAMIGGNSTMDLAGYPKFISDQLWGKALLQDSVVGTVEYYDGQTYPSNRNRADRIPNQSRMNALANPNGAYSNSTMKFMGPDGAVVSIDPTSVGNNADDTGRAYLGELGRLRFDTKFARNLFFLANVQRLMTYKIGTELTKLTYPVAVGNQVANRKITDYNDGETFADLSID